MFLVWLANAVASPFPMWGAGVTAQTNLYPFGYPLSLLQSNHFDSSYPIHLTHPFFLNIFGCNETGCPLDTMHNNA